jgi:hypothetical protein
MLLLMMMMQSCHTPHIPECRQIKPFCEAIAWRRHCCRCWG